MIGSLLIDPEHVAGEVFIRAKPEHFSEAAYRHIFQSAHDLWRESRPIDPVTVLDAAGGSYEQLLRDAMIQTPTAANVAAYLDILQSSAQLSRLQSAAMEIINANSAEQAAAIYERMGESLSAMEDVEDVSWAEAVGDYIDRMEDKTPPDYLGWGIKPLDDVLNVSPGKFIILAADSSVGKTALALQFAYHIAETGKKVGFFSLETDKESLTDRLMAETQVAGIRLPSTKRKSLTETDFRSAAAAGMKSDKIPLRLIRRADTIEQIRSRTVRHRFDVIFIDYVQLIDAAGQERWQTVTNVSMALHRMAQKLGVTVIGLSQITPPDKNSKRSPSKDDLRESRQLKHDADVIMIMSVPDPKNSQDRLLRIDKNKDGPRADLMLRFDAAHMSFEHLPPYEDERQARARKMDENKQRRLDKAAEKETRAAGDPAQVKFEDLPDGSGGKLPF